MNLRRCLLLCTLALTTTAAGCQEAEEGRPFQVVAAQRQTLAISAEAAGILEPVTMVEIKSKASGEILSIPVETGDVVEQGQLLVQVEQTDARQTLAQSSADLEVAEARLKIAESQLERSQRMREQEIISDQDFEAAELEHANAKAQLVRAQSMLETARERMAETTIRAPITGTIIDRTVEVGNVISSATQVVGGGTLLMTMADLQEVQVRTLVDETDIGRVQPTMPADIQVEAFRDRTFQGRVLKIEPQATVTQNVTMFPVIIRIRNEEQLLKPGMSAEVTIQVANTENAITVPTQAVHPPEDAREVAELALGLSPDSFREMLASNTPQEASNNGAHEPSGSNGQGEGTQPSQADMEAMRRRMQSGQASQDDMRRMRQMAEQAHAAQEQQKRSGGPIPGVVFVMREGELVPLPVQVGVTDWESIEVVSGLQEGDSVALLPTAALLRDQVELLERFQRFRGGGVPGMRSQGT